MSPLKPLGEKFPVEQQFGVGAEPEVLVNAFTLNAADESAFVAAWKDDAELMKRQSGFISTQFHRDIGESPTYLNYAVRESTADFRAVFRHPEFIAKLSAYPSSAVATPRLFQKVAVAGICTS